MLNFIQYLLIVYVNCLLELKVNLEMNKEELAAEFVCLLDINSRPQDVAQLKKLIEQFFSYGAARIDLIGKVMDLDNEIHGLNLDIPLLEETKHSIETLSTTGEFYATS